MNESGEEVELPDTMSDLYDKLICGSINFTDKGEVNCGSRGQLILTGWNF